MDSAERVVSIFRDVSGIAVVQIVAIVVIAWVALLVDQRVLPLLAHRLPARFRLHVLAAIPVVRLLVMIVAAVLVLQRLVDPTLENMVALLGVIGIGLGFALKDYAGSLIAGTVSLYENPYRPGDWISIEGTYGEVKSINLRTVSILTPDDTLVTIPHNTLWNSPVFNSNAGTTNLQCVASFFLKPEHDGQAVRQRLRDVALSSPLVKLSQPVTVVAVETRWGTHYRIRCYPVDPAQQFAFITDLSERGRAALMALGVQFALAAAVAER
ncbi:MAG: mechanosensitive ion channel family protein [Spirochaetaceae bacterium]|nr:MAG: mechanosensitive ion channel family protein [Spirochaetaceae bacterium]